MSQPVKRTLVSVLAFLSFTCAFAQATDSDTECKAATEAAQKVRTTGPSDVPLRDLAVLKLPANHSYIPAPAADQLMRCMGNGTDSRLMGVIFPPGNEDWMVVVRYVNEGYIKDDEAKDWNADDLLKSLKEGTEEANEERTKRGIPAIEVIGWAEKPRYDAPNHRLVWSASSRAKGSTSTEGLGVNYNTYALGRDGYISLNLVTNLDDLEKHKPAALDLLAALQYKDGHKYSDFNNSTDKVAAYGLGALVAGAAAKKLGLLAVIFAFAAKFAKVLIVAAGAAFWGIAKFFGKKKE